MANKNITKLLQEFQKNPKNVRFGDLSKVCEHYFGKARQLGTSHRIYKTPWPGNPRVNIQKDKSGKAKSYQVKQILAAVKKLEDLSDE